MSPQRFLCKCLQNIFVNVMAAWAWLRESWFASQHFEWQMLCVTGWHWMPSLKKLLLFVSLQWKIAMQPTLLQPHFNWLSEICELACGPNPITASLPHNISLFLYWNIPKAIKLWGHCWKLSLHKHTSRIPYASETPWNCFSKNCIDFSFSRNSFLLLVLRVAVCELSKTYYSHATIIAHGRLCHIQYSALYSATKTISLSYVVWTTEFIDLSFQPLVAFWKGLDGTVTLPSVAAVRKHGDDGHNSSWQPISLHLITAAKKHLPVLLEFFMGYRFRTRRMYWKKATP